MIFMLTASCLLALVIGSIILLLFSSWQAENKNALYAVTLLIEILTGGLFRFITATLFFILALFLPMLILSYDSVLDGLNLGRYYNTSPVSFLGDFFGPLFGISGVLGAIIGFGPIVTSLLSLFRVPGGGGFTKTVLGAREPSHRELVRINDAFKQVQAGYGRNVTGFSDYYVIDSPIEVLYTIGSSLYISSGTIDGDYLTVLVAHEVGHSMRGDGALILALRRLVFPIAYLFLGNIRDFSTAGGWPRAGKKKERSESDIFYAMINKLIFFVLAFLGGGMGVYFLSGPWAHYIRECDYDADAFVAMCGMKDELIDWLEEKRFYDAAVPYMLGWQPANELRIDQLLKSAGARSAGQALTPPPVTRTRQAVSQRPATQPQQVKTRVQQQQPPAARPQSGHPAISPVQPSDRFVELSAIAQGILSGQAVSPRDPQTLEGVNPVDFLSYAPGISRSQAEADMLKTMLNRFAKQVGEFLSDKQSNALRLQLAGKPESDRAQISLLYVDSIVGGFDRRFKTWLLEQKGKMLVVRLEAMLNQLQKEGGGVLADEIQRAIQLTNQNKWQAAADISRKVMEQKGWTANLSS